MGFTPRFFLHWLNREILRLYAGPRAASNNATLGRVALRLTRYALTLTDKPLIIPPAALFELDFVGSYLSSLSAVCRSQLVQFSSPTSDLGLYAVQKQREYRDESPLFGRYVTAVPVVDERYLQHLHWLPRVRKSASREISRTWVDELVIVGGVINQLAASRAQRHGGVSNKIETSLASLPERLEGRAFIMEHVTPLLPIDLTPRERSDMDLMLSRAWIMSFLSEYDASLLVDTPLGLLDCGVNYTDASGCPRLFSFRVARTIYSAVGIDRAIEKDLSLASLIECMSEPIVGWFRDLVLAELHSTVSGRLASLLVYAGYRRPELAARKLRAGDVRDILYRLYDKISPFVEKSRGEMLTRERPLSWEGSAVQLRFWVDNGEQMDPRNVFLVHGRDNDSVKSMKAYLRALGLNPIDWDEAVAWTGNPCPYVLDVIEKGLERARVALVLFTPDEHVHLRPELVAPGGDAQEGFQPRPNVLVEAGMALARHPKETIIVQIGNIRSLSDLEGLHFVRFDGSAESRKRLFDRLRIAGCSCTEHGGDFLSVGFEYLKPKTH